jgi:3-oxoacyl-[acyl-carrier protein] reductase
MTQKPLNQQVAIVTGAGRGIGRAIAIEFARAGASVVCAARTGREIEETAQTIRRDRGKGIALEVDVTSESSVMSMVEATVQLYHRLDLLVINAGCNLDHRTVSESVSQDWRQTIETNLFGAYCCAKAAIPFLKVRGGKIITIGSGLGHKGTPKRSAYSYSKRRCGC